jgi:dynein heavy chain 1
LVCGLETPNTGQVRAFIVNHLKSRADSGKVTETSFARPKEFRKALESAVRFGTSLVVSDAEKYDPIMNPVLNREYQKIGGRVIMTIADQEIDVSKPPTIVLVASEPAFKFAPDLCSRVTMANFSVTRSSLQAQCLSQVLRAERPDIQKKQHDLLEAGAASVPSPSAHLAFSLPFPSTISASASIYNYALAHFPLR